MFFMHNNLHQRISRTVYRRSTQETGQAVIALVLGIMLILSTGAAIMVTNVIRHDPIVQRDVVAHYAYRAVESGFDSFLSTVNANPNEMNCTATTKNVGECPIGRYKIWRQVTGTTGGAGVVPEDFWWTDPRFCYTPACSPTAAQTPGLIYVKVAIWGRAGFFPSDYVFQKTTADLQSENGFLTHIWWSDYESTDPHNTTHTTSACTYDWNNTYKGPIAPLPAITSVTPSSGPTSGGTPVIITGTHLSGATAVHFGTKTAATFTITATTHTKITATTPASAAGTDGVSVTAVGGTARKPTAFTFTALPTVTGVTPSSGPTTGGTVVTITGTNFSARTASVKFGTTPATLVTVTSPTQVKATSPSGVAGAVGVSVTNLGGTGTDRAAFTYVAPPAVTSVSPSSGPTTGGTTVTITGTDFSIATAAVKFGSTGAASFTVTSPTTIKAVTESHAAGTVDVSVTTASGAAGKTTAFTFTAVPTLGTLAPTSGPQGGGTRVVITGTNFSARTASVTFGTVPATTVTVTSSTRMTAKTPAHATGTVGVTVTNLGGSATKAAAYTYNAAGTAVTVTSVTPDHGPATSFTSTTVVIHGTNFNTGKAATVTFGTNNATYVKVTSKTTITVKAPTEGAGTVNVSVTQTRTTKTEPTAFTYLASPTVSSVTPNYGPTGGGTVVTIAGTHFTGATAVTFGGTAATTVAVTSATKITARTPAHATGVVTVSVTASGETGTDSRTAFDYQHPTSPGAVTVTNVSPSRGHGGTTVVITGSGFATPITVKFGTITATATVKVTSSTRISAKAPLEDGGIVSVSVTDAAGTGTDPTAFTYTNTGACSPVYFGPTTQVYGPIFSNDSIYVTSPTVPHRLGPIETHDPKCVAVTGTGGLGTCVKPTKTPTALSKPTTLPDKDKVAYEPIPRSDSALATYASEKLPTARGCLYHGPTTIEFDSHDKMTVWSPDSTPTSTCLPSQGATVDVPNGGHASTVGNGVVYVATETTTAKCKSGANPFDNLVTGGTGTKSQLGRYERIGSITPNCEADAFVSDAPASTSPPPTPTKPTTLAGISGQLTVGSSANIVVTGIIGYTHCGGTFASTKTDPCRYHFAGKATTKTPTNPTVTEPNDVLGLIANDYVEVNRPVGTSIAGCTAAVTGKPGAAVCEPGPLTIDAAILALQHSFAVNNFTVAGSIGTLTVYGTIDQKWRGAVGKTTGRGYTKDYDWDSRVTAVTPPHYLNPSTPSWALASSSVSSESHGPTPT